MNDLSPQQTPADLDFEEALVLAFLTNYHTLEQALMRAGFTRAGCTPGTYRPDWSSFARHIQSRFDPACSTELLGAVSYLLLDPHNKELRSERLQTCIPGEGSSPQSDLLWLWEIVEGLRNRLLFQIGFAEKPWSDHTGVMSALLVVEAWSYIDPKVESMLPHVQCTVA